ncbi:MAG: DUF202 domain-containing protein [Amaricoccus sp.]
MTRTPEADANSRLAFDRTRLAYERTMLSWIRTATSLITFGFGIHQVFRIADAAAPGALRAEVPHVFGSVMVVAGLATLLLASLDHRGSMRALAAEYPPSAGYPQLPRSYARLMAALIGLLGVGALVLMHLP